MFARLLQRVRRHREDWRRGSARSPARTRPGCDEQKIDLRVHVTIPPYNFIIRANDEQCYEDGSAKEV